MAVACGGRQETMAGLAGLGDLVLTCTGGLSRNRSVGVELGRGRKLPEIIADMHGAVAEGVFTTQAAVGLAQARGVEMPIAEQMDAILHRGKSPADAIQDLMTRSAKSEMFSYRHLASGLPGIHTLDVHLLQYYRSDFPSGTIMFTAGFLRQSAQASGYWDTSDRSFAATSSTDFSNSNEPRILILPVVLPSKISRKSVTAEPRRRNSGGATRS